jgi:D-aminopeptidase
VISAITVPLAALSLLVLSISVDMEGVAGVVTSDQLASGGFEYQRLWEKSG